MVPPHIAWFSKPIGTPHGGETALFAAFGSPQKVTKTGSIVDSLAFRRHKHGRGAGLLVRAFVTAASARNHTRNRTN
jgi:hypothetical protein